MRTAQPGISMRGSGGRRMSESSAATLQTYRTDRGRAVLFSAEPASRWRYERQIGTHEQCGGGPRANAACLSSPGASDARPERCQGAPSPASPPRSSAATSLHSTAILLYSQTHIQSPCDARSISLVLGTCCQNCVSLPLVPTNHARSPDLARHSVRCSCS